MPCEQVDAKRGGSSFHVDVAVDNKSICQTTVQSSTSCVGSKEIEVLWNQDFNIPLLHLRTKVVLSLFAAKNNVMVGQVTLPVVSLPRGGSGGGSDGDRNKRGGEGGADTDRSATMYPLLLLNGDRGGYLSATAVIEVCVCVYVCVACMSV